jgi:dTDP-4-dehydrorhamnose reductase
LVLGASGMLGHKLVQRLRERFEVFASIRSSFDQVARLGVFEHERTVDHVDAASFDTVIRAMAFSKPDAVINGIGIIKQLTAARDPLVTIKINSLFPHRLADLCRAAGARMIHISTDCVFSGKKGMYREEDLSDAEDLYGRSKFLGEVSAPGALTLRTSIIGRELRGSNGLVEWFLSQRGAVRGFRRAIFSGLTTLVLVDLIGDILVHHEDLSGLYHVSSDPINKYELLRLLSREYNRNLEIEPDDTVKIDRSLDSRRLRDATGFVPPPWPQMIEHMAEESIYVDWRKQRAS